MESTIFYGNGVNLLSKDGKSWDTILRDISPKQILPPIGSNTLKYEYIVLPKERYTERDYGIEITVDGIPEPPELIDTEHLIKENLSKELSRSRPAEFFNNLADIEADNYITTNYESFLYPPLIDKGYEKKDPDNPLFRLKPHHIFEKGNLRIRIWNIHGSIELNEYLMLGLHEYSEYVIEIDKIIKAIERNKKVDETSWPYVMLNSNVHILGYGLGYEEIDVWHFLTCRKRLIRKNIIKKNKIVFYAIKDGSYDPGKIKLLEALDVIVRPIEFDWSDNAYKNAYNEIYNILRESITKSQ